MSSRPSAVHGSCAEDRDVTAVGGEHGREDPQQRGLAGAVRPEQPGDARRRRQVDVAAGRPSSRTACERPRIEIGGLSRRRSSRSPCLHGRKSGLGASRARPARRRITRANATWPEDREQRTVREASSAPVEDAGQQDDELPRDCAADRRGERRKPRRQRESGRRSARSPGSSHPIGRHSRPGNAADPARSTATDVTSTATVRRSTRPAPCIGVATPASPAGSACRRRTRRRRRPTEPAGRARGTARRRRPP